MSLRVKQRKSKKAVSIIIGYVLLITFAVIIGVIVYKWMKTYVPQEELSCPGGSTLFLESYNYNCTSSMLTLKIVNNGNFDIGGYFIYATDSPNKQLATIDLTSNQTDSLSKLQPLGVKFGSPIEKNALGPGDNEIEIYNLTGTGRIYSLEIIPIRWQTEKRKMFLVSCDNSKLKETIDCFTPCIAEEESVTCDGIECGTRMNNCGEEIDCGPGCTAPEECNILGQCVDPEDCTDTCDGFECGEICGIPCGNCPDLSHASEICSANLCELGICDTGWGNCDGNDANGCETPLGTDENCASCGDDCGTESCIGGMCGGGGTSTCDGTWTGSSSEDVECDGGSYCLGDCTCPTGSVPDYLGGCMYIGGSQSCILYCLESNELYETTYTSSGCTQNPGQCTGPGGGDALPGGNSQCVGAPTGPVCCCYPAQ